jgi:hypothetical protein
VLEDSEKEIELGIYQCLFPFDNVLVYQWGKHGVACVEHADFAIVGRKVGRYVANGRLQNRHIAKQPFSDLSRCSGVDMYRHPLDMEETYKVVRKVVGYDNCRAGDIPLLFREVRCAHGDD